MRILFISLMVPLPANNGYKMRTWSILRGLAEEGHEIHFVSFTEPGEICSDSRELSRLCCTVRMVPLAHRSLTSSSDYFSRFLGLLSSRPYATRRFSSTKMQQRIQQHLSEGNLDAIMCDTADAACNLPRTSLPLILNHHNVEHLILERYLPFEPNPAKRLYAWIESRKVKSWERKVCQMSAIGLACSEHDCRELERLAPGSRVFVVPNVVNTNSFAPNDDYAEDLQTVVYQGGLDWFPNRDAVEFFVGEMMPILRREVPGIRFVVAGRNPSDEFRKKFAGMPDVEFTGTVSDMRPIVAGAALCVVPLRIGSGTRLKILEAAAMGKAIVSTSLGAEGLDFVRGEEIAIGDRPERFAQAVAKLLADAELRHAMGERARQRVERQYSLSALREAIADALRNHAAPPKRKAVHGELTSRYLPLTRGRAPGMVSYPIGWIMKRRGPFGLARWALRGLLYRFWLRLAPAGRREAMFDEIRGTDTEGCVDPRELGTDHPHLPYAVAYVPSRPHRFSSLLKRIPRKCRDFLFIDVGCGKGRCLLLAHEAGFRKILGVELSPRLADVARANVAHLPGVEVVCQDALEFELPSCDSVVYLFNPFREPLMTRFVSRLERSLQEHPRQIYVIYLAPLCESSLLISPAFERVFSSKEEFSIFLAKPRTEARRQQEEVRRGARRESTTGNRIGVPEELSLSAPAESARQWGSHR